MGSIGVGAALLELSVLLLSRLDQWFPTELDLWAFEMWQQFLFASLGVAAMDCIGVGAAGVVAVWGWSNVFRWSRSCRR